MAKIQLVQDGFDEYKIVANDRIIGTLDLPSMITPLRYESLRNKILDAVREVEVEDGLSEA
jgi:hypothetical protein